MNEQLPFPYHLAFDRNLGWVTDWEQLALRAKTVAIAGMGGVGGVHLLTLARLGIGGFAIADFDSFEFANFNRQIGATLATIGRPKALVLEEMARAINPELRIRRFDAGVTAETVETFLDGADLFVDGLDFFEIAIRRQLFARCRERGIPAVTAAPIGMGAGYLVFTPEGMSFERYFRFEGQRPEEQFLRFLMGLVPRGLHRRYLVDPGRINLAARKGPSTAAAVQLCAGVTAAAAVKLLLGRGGVKPAPWHYQFDAYLDRLAVTRLPFGLGGPVQQVKLALARRTLARAGRRTVAPEPPEQGRRPIEEILNLARWAPSGDNAQPWRFRILDDETIAVSLRLDPTSVYEYRDGEPTLLAVGMLVETLDIAASAYGRAMQWQSEGSDTRRRLLVRFPTAPESKVDPLASVLTLRSVDRRPYRLRGLLPREKAALEAALISPPLAGGIEPRSGSMGEGAEAPNEQQPRLLLRVDWHESLATRWRCARLNGMATDIRLRCPEAFPIHQRVIDWRLALSPDGIPARAVGLPAPMLPMLRWALSDWSRMQRLNRWAGTWGTRAQLDYLPGLAGTFVVFRRAATGPTTDPGRGLIEAGQAIQRFWLTATRLGLAMQPTVAMLAFAEYGQSGTSFTTEAALRSKATVLARQFRNWLGAPADQVVFAARIGEPRRRLPSVRSTRLPLDRLIESDGSTSEDGNGSTPKPHSG
jgi:sulfur-carrier protein adenylyltransferase/sulfurtransferase